MRRIKYSQHNQTHNIVRHMSGFWCAENCGISKTYMLFTIQSLWESHFKVHSTHQTHGYHRFFELDPILGFKI